MKKVDGVGFMMMAGGVVSALAMWCKIDAVKQRRMIWTFYSEGKLPSLFWWYLLLVVCLALACWGGYRLWIRGKYR